MAANARADEALARLIDGNRRFVAGVRDFPNQTLEHRREVAALQHPFAAILTCADSRVVPEIIFDQGLGDLFVVRVAGNVVDDMTIASLEFAVRYVAVPLILVLGHIGCAAVQAAIDGGELEGSLPALVAAIRPAVELARSEPGPLAENAVRMNVELVVDELRFSAPILLTAAALGDVRIVGAVYDMVSGVVALV